MIKILKEWNRKYMYSTLFHKKVEVEYGYKAVLIKGNSKKGMITFEIGKQTCDNQKLLHQRFRGIHVATCFSDVFNHYSSSILNGEMKILYCRIDGTSIQARRNHGNSVVTSAITPVYEFNMEKLLKYIQDNGIEQKTIHQQENKELLNKFAAQELALFYKQI